jgi:hypothetical protein
VGQSREKIAKGKKKNQRAELAEIKGILPGRVNEPTGGGNYGSKQTALLFWRAAYPFPFPRKEVGRPGAARQYAAVARKFAHSARLTPSRLRILS